MSEENLSKEVHARVLRNEIIPQSGMEQRSTQSRPRAVVLAGQPGAGKGSLKDAAKLELNFDVITIDPDELRDTHPHVEKLRERYPYTWADHTHADASAWAKELRAAAMEGKKNLILDTTLGNGQGAVSLINQLRDNGYEVEVRVMAAHQLESELGVYQRFSQSLDTKGHGRFVPSSVRQQVYEDLPRNLKQVWTETGVTVRLFNREGQELYDSRYDKGSPGVALKHARQGRIEDPVITRQVAGEWKRMGEWNDKAISDIDHNPHVSADGRMQFRSQHPVQTTAHVKHYIPAAHVQDIETSIHRPVYRAGSLLGGAATAYDAADTARSTRALLEQGNAAGAQAGILRFGMRNAGGWAGAWAGVQLGALAGVETGPGAVVTAVIGGAAGAIGGEKVADWIEHHRINTQADAQGQRWRFDPADPERGWTRTVRELDVEATTASLSEMPIYQAPRMLTADAALADRLDYQAASMAVQLRLASPDLPVNPYRIPADADDSHSVRESPWIREPVTRQWQREVADGLLDHRVLQWRAETASPSKSAELDTYAEQVLAYNAERSPAANAARYAQVHEQMDWRRHGPIPEAVHSALRDHDTLLASDGGRYRRQDDGRWISPGFFHDSVAEGSLRDELDAARERQRVHLAPQQRLAPSSSDNSQRFRNADAAFLDAYCDALGRGDRAACQRSAADYEALPQTRMFLQSLRTPHEATLSERREPEREPQPVAPVADVPSPPAMRR